MVENGSRSSLFGRPGLNFHEAINSPIELPVEQIQLEEKVTELKEQLKRAEESKRNAMEYSRKLEGEISHLQKQLDDSNRVIIETQSKLKLNSRISGQTESKLRLEVLRKSNQIAELEDIVSTLNRSRASDLDVEWQKENIKQLEDDLEKSKLRCSSLEYELADAKRAQKFRETEAESHRDLLESLWKKESEIEQLKNALRSSRNQVPNSIEAETIEPKFYKENVPNNQPKEKPLQAKTIYNVEQNEQKSYYDLERVLTERIESFDS